MAADRLPGPAQETQWLCVMDGSTAPREVVDPACPKCGRQMRLAARPISAAVSPAEPREDNADGDWLVNVNGQVTTMPITPETRLDRIIKPATELTGNTGQPESAWEIRDRRGRLLYNGSGLGFGTVGELQEHGEIVDDSLWISLKPGVGA